VAGAAVARAGHVPNCPRPPAAGGSRPPAAGGSERIVGAAGGAKRKVGSEEARVPVAAEHHLKMTSYKGLCDDLAELHPQLAPTAMSVAKPDNGDLAGMYIGAMFEGDCLLLAPPPAT
jgi:hypothetical protein